MQVKEGSDNVHTEARTQKEENEEIKLKKKTIHRDSNTRPTINNRSGYPSTCCCTITLWTTLCVLILTTTHFTFRNKKSAKNTVLQGLSRHEARTTEAAPRRVGRGEQGEARPGNSAPSDGPQIELSRRRLKTLSKSDTVAALVQAPTYLYVYLYFYNYYNSRRVRIVYLILQAVCPSYHTHSASTIIPNAPPAQCLRTERFQRNPTRPLFFLGQSLIIICFRRKSLLLENSLQP